MIKSLFSKFWIIEYLARRFCYKFPSFKKSLKGIVKKQKRKKEAVTKRFNLDAVINELSNTRSKIVIVHSSFSILSRNGITLKDILVFLNSLIEKGFTVVLPVYPITNLEKKDGAMPVFDELNTPCWTGLIPNIFLKLDGVFRSSIPFNTLAAKGPLAKKMMANDFRSIEVYDKYSPWAFCLQHDASILFLGTTSAESNTIQTHMIPDILGKEWPIKDWYEEVDAPILRDSQIIKRKLLIQKDYWTQFVIDYYTNNNLFKENILKKFAKGECPIELIGSSKDMVDSLISKIKKNRCSYRFPSYILRRYNND